MKTQFLLLLICSIFGSQLFAHGETPALLKALGTSSPVPTTQHRWQQRVSYKMEIDMDVEKNTFSGIQELAYTNNSPDTLNSIFYHLYYNAFQPGSVMDMNTRKIADPDGDLQRNIQYLLPEDIGYQKIKVLKYRGESITYSVQGTILEVPLPTPILPGETVNLYMEFEAQVPQQSIRTGRDNLDGISFSMGQWYPKLCEYDYEGWHANPYVGREFHGVWGDFEVRLHIDRKYIVAATGYLQNPNEIGYGYEENGAEIKRPDSEKLTWHFLAPNVHDFVWAADQDYTHIKTQVPDGPLIHFFYQKDEHQIEWKTLPSVLSATFQVANKIFGKYPYEEYSVIQGGDRGMEYPMATLISNAGSPDDFVDVAVHEIMHSWYQMVLATNESLYSWMDEGFTTYASELILDIIRQDNSLNPHGIAYMDYLNLVKGNKVEPMTTHADHFSYNETYWTSAYSRGAIFLNQLSYIIGERNFFSGMLRYYNTWKFKHPNPTDFKRIMEKESGLELDWYFEYWINSTHHIDYAVKSVQKFQKGSEITFKRIGKMPMPLDVLITYKDGNQELFCIPLFMMRGEKPMENLYSDIKRSVVQDWSWTDHEYQLKISTPPKEIKHIVIDPSYRMADVDRSNNRFPKKKLIGNFFYGGLKKRADITK